MTYNTYCSIECARTHGKVHCKNSSICNDNKLVKALDKIDGINNQYVVNDIMGDPHDSRRLQRNFDYYIRAIGSIKTRKSRATIKALHKKMYDLRLEEEEKVQPQMLGIGDMISAFSSLPREAIDAFSMLANSAKKATEQGVKIDQDVLDRADAFAESMNLSSSVLNNLIEGGINHNISFDNPFKGVFSWLWENRSGIGRMVIVFLTLFFVFQKNSVMVGLCISFLGFCFYAATSDPFLYGMSETFSRMVMSMGYVSLHSDPSKVDFNEIVPQSYDDKFIKIGLILAFISSFGGCDTRSFSDLISGKVEEALKIPPRIDGITGQVNRLIDMFQSIANWILETVNVDYRFALSVDKYPQATQLLSDVADFQKNVSGNPRDLIVNKAAQTSQRMQAQIHNMLIKNKSDRDFQPTARLLMQAKHRLENIDRELELRGAGKSVTRVAPKAIMIMGHPGIGKSYALRCLSTFSLYKLYGKDPLTVKRIEEQMRDFIFTRNSDDKFWEGYFNQPIILLDEVAMQRDVAGSAPESNEYSNFIKMVNDVTFPLLMADVDKKGTREFDSELIFGTTNARHFNIESINNKDAYDRRWSIKAEVYVPPEYGYYFEKSPGVGYYKPDFDKIRSVMTEEEVACSAFLRFRFRRSLFTQEIIREDVTFSQFLDEIGKLVEEREQAKVDTSTHQGLLHKLFRPKFDEKVPGSFIEPQSGEGCRCHVCSDNFTGNIINYDSTEYGKIFSDFPAQMVESVYRNGFNSVNSVDDLTYMSDQVCIHVLRKNNPLHGTLAIMNTHGAQVRSRMISVEQEVPRGIVSYIKANVKKILAFLAGISTLVGVYQSLRYLFGAKTNDEPIYPQYEDLNAKEVLDSVVSRNVYAWGDNLFPARGFMMFIADNMVAIPRHYIAAWIDAYAADNDYTVELRRLGDKVNHQVLKFKVDVLIRKENIFFFDNDVDVAVVYLDNKMLQRSRSMRKYLMSNAQHHQHGEVIFPNVDQRTLEYSPVSGVFVASPNRSYEDNHGKTLFIKRPISYNIATRSGDCGLPVVVKDPKLRSDKVFGFHAAGSPRIGKGFAQPFTVEMFDAAYDHFSKLHQIIISQYKTDIDVLHELKHDGPGFDDLYAVPACIEVPGKVNLGYVKPVPIPMRTNIVPSPIYKEVGFKPETKPAFLRPFIRDGKTIYPERNAISKYHHSIEALDLEVLDCCVDNYTDLLLNHPQVTYDEEVGNRVLTVEEAIRGIPGVDGLDGLPRKSSAGVPWCAMVDKPGKQDMFGSDGDYVFDTPMAKKVLARVDQIISDAKSNKRAHIVFRSFLKDERRPILKVEAGKTRNISGCPVDYSICVRMYFGAFIAFFTRNRIINQAAVGINPYNSEWDYLAEYLGTDKRIIAGDFSNYDGKLPYCIMIRFLSTMTQFYGDKGSENERIREVLFQELVNSRHLNSEGVIYEWVGSNASGNPLTTILNSWCNNVILRYATLRCLNLDNMMMAPKFLSGMDNYVRFMTYGDDNLISIERNCVYADLLNQNNYTKALADMGFEYTDEDKSGGEIDQDRSITDVSFLKRGWFRTSVLPQRRFLSALSIKTIMESIQWTKKEGHS